jgi:hypothetical protein
LNPYRLIRSKRPEFPSGMSLALRTTMSLWLMRWKWGLGVGLAGGGNLQSSMPGKTKDWR